MYAKQSRKLARRGRSTHIYILYQSTWCYVFSYINCREPETHSLKHFWVASKLEMSHKNADVLDTPEPSARILSILTDHLPHSLALLRRLQFTRFSGGKTDNTHVLSVFPDGGSHPDEAFAIAYLDFSRGPYACILLTLENTSPEEPLHNFKFVILAS